MTTVSHTLNRLDNPPQLYSSGNPDIHITQPTQTLLLPVAPNRYHTHHTNILPTLHQQYFSPITLKN